MKSVIPEMTCQLQECIAFVMARCKAHGLSPSLANVEQDGRVSIHAGGVSLSLIFSIYKAEGNRVVESRAEKCFLLTDPAPGPLFSFVSYIESKLSLMCANRILKTIHSEINNRFT